MRYDVSEQLSASGAALVGILRLASRGALIDILLLFVIREEAVSLEERILMPSRVAAERSDSDAGSVLRLNVQPGLSSGSGAGRKLVAGW